MALLSLKVTNAIAPAGGSTPATPTVQSVAVTVPQTIAMVLQSSPDLLALVNAITALQFGLGLEAIGTMGGLLGSTQTFTLSSTQLAAFIGTMNTDLLMTLAAPGAAFGLIFGSQDAVGGHVLSILDGSTPTPLTEISTVANTPFLVLVLTPNGVDFAVAVIA